MFNIGAGEVIVIALVLLVAVGPEQLPGLIRRVGRTVAEVRAMADSLRSEFMDSVDEMERAVDPSSWAADTAGADTPETPRSADDDPEAPRPAAGDGSALERPDSTDPAPHRRIAGPAADGTTEATNGEHASAPPDAIESQGEDDAPDAIDAPGEDAVPEPNDEPAPQASGAVEPDADAPHDAAARAPGTEPTTSMAREDPS